MQKNYTISCCVECPAFMKKGYFCKKSERIIDQDTSSSVDLTLVGFPEWCLLPDVLVGDPVSFELKKVARQVLKRLDLEADDDAIASVSHYLSTVVEVKDTKKEKGADLFSGDSGNG